MLGKSYTPTKMPFHDKVLTLDASELVPFVTWGTNPEMGVPFDGTFPEITSPDMQKAYDYMDLKPGQTPADIPVGYVFIVSVPTDVCLICKRLQRSSKEKKFMRTSQLSWFLVHAPFAKRQKRLAWIKFL